MKAHRRDVLGGLAALAAPFPVLAAEGVSSAHTLPARRSEPPPDAELIRLCAEHPARIAAANDHGSGLDDCPLWLAYERSRDAICNAKPQTMAGMIAKAKAAKAEATDFNGEEMIHGSGTMGETWAWDLVNDLLRLEGTL
jgi:hypothetical protein